jgi:steroid 5-alpha reductase family enzyme
LPAFIVNATQRSVDRLVWSDVAGTLLYVLGLGLEAVADHQKSAWKADPANKGRWIDVGLW